MHRFSYDNQGSNCYLIYMMKDNEEVDQTALHMIKQNEIPHLLSAAYTQIDRNRYLRYALSSTAILKKMLSGVITRVWLLNVFESVCSAVLSAEEYLLDSNSFVLDWEYVFVDSVSGKASLVYLPVLGGTEAADIPEFFRMVVTNVKPDPGESGDYITRILYYLNSNEKFSLTDFHKLIKELQYQNTAENVQSVSKEKERKNISARKEVPGKGKREEDIRDRVIPKSKGQPPRSKGNIEMDRENDRPEFQPGYGFDIPGGKKKTVPASPEERGDKGNAQEDNISLMYLLRNFSGENLQKYRSQGQGKKEKTKSGKEKKKKQKGMLTLVSLEPAHPMEFTVNQFPFTIGRRKANHAVMTGFKKISREHCWIVQEKDAYFVLDRGSTFGTIVDGMKCVPDQKSGVLEENSVIELPGIRFRVEFR